MSVEFCDVQLEERQVLEFTGEAESGENYVVPLGDVLEESGVDFPEEDFPEDLPGDVGAEAAP
eukprot:6378074-Amphidinium_carterae.1